MKRLSVVLGAMALLAASHMRYAQATTVCDPPPTGLSGWWPGDNNANDIIGNNAGALSGGGTFAAGEVLQAFYFPTSGSADIPYSNAATPQGITVAAWVNPATTAGSAAIFNWRPMANVVGVTLEQRYTGDGEVLWNVFATGDTGVASATSGANLLPLNTWTHIAGTYDGTTAALYFNGVVVGNATTTTGPLATITADAKIGKNIVNGASFIGLIDEVEVFNRALSIEEIQAIVHAGSAGVCKDVVFRNGFESPDVAQSVKAFSVTGPASTSAGSPFSITVAAEDAFGNTVSGYAGTMHFSSSDGAAVLPSDYTFVAGDNGAHTFIGVTLKTAGSQTITATDTVTSSITGTQSSITVSPAAAASLILSGFPSPVVAGSSHSITVAARDPFSNIVTGYTGTVHFTSSDGAAVLPSDYTFLAADAGVHVFVGIQLKTASASSHQSITATDTVTPSITGTQSSIAVSPAAAASLIVSGFPSTVVAGSSDSITVTAKDPFGNVASGYRGTVHFTSSDGTAMLPSNYTFGATASGVQVFVGIQLKTASAGSQSITATDTVTASITGTQSSITVSPAAAASLILSGFPSPVVAGSSHSITVAARDPFSNIVTGYTGTVHFTSSDAAAVLPSDYTFNAGDSGVHTFAGVTLNTAGSQTITATDTVTSSITGTQSGITVN